MPVDEEMTNAADAPTSPLPNGTQDHSSSTMDHDHSAQAEGQSSGNAPHHNRKDATLREFLSKMDEYAPIVCRPPHHAALLHSSHFKNTLHCTNQPTA